jgi:hypothetical protein
MGMTRSLVSGTVAAAMLVGAASPALARPRYYGGHGWGHHYHRGGGSTFGALLGGLVIGGAAVAIASSVDRNNDRHYDAEYTAPPPPPPPPPAVPSRIADTQGQAVDICSREAEGQRSPNAQVNDITRVTREGDGWRVEGVIDTGNTRYDGYREIGSFSCSIAYGEVRDLRFDVAPRS